MNEILHLLFPNVGQLSYADMHRDTSRKCMTTPQDAEWLVTKLDTLYQNTHEGLSGTKYKSTDIQCCK